jgi:hypothetical protein
MIVDPLIMDREKLVNLEIKQNIALVIINGIIGVLIEYVNMNINIIVIMVLFTVYFIHFIEKSTNSNSII